MRSIHRPLTLTVAALGLGLALTGCTGTQHGTQRPTRPSGAPTTSPADPGAAEMGASPQLQAFLDDDASGTGPQIALRFLQALQAGDDLAADRELYGWERMLLAGQDLEFLHTVMNDVRRTAGLDKAGPCRTAEWIDSEQVAVTCGSTTVMVRVWDDELARGVRIADGHGDDDTGRGAHTHATSTLEL